MSLLAQIAIFLAAAVIAIPIFRRFNLGSVLGYLTAGIIIGPASLGLINSVDATQNIAQFGIVLLMFVIGLELQPSRLWVLRKSIFVLGAAQVAVTTLCIGAGAYLIFAQPAGPALVIGFALSMSSTALALQLLAERGQLNTHVGRSAFSILLFQDVSVLPALALLPLLGAAAAKSGGSGWLVLKLIAVLATIIFGGRYVLNPLLRIVAATRVAEAFTAAGLLIVLGTALLVSQVGLSLSLGAFLAGVLLADSEFRHQLEADIEPFKGLLLGLFFISVGMSANLTLVREKPLAIIGMTLAFMLLKLGILWMIGRMSGLSPAASRGLAFSLPSGGEFAFVLFGLAASLGIMNTENAELLVLVVTASMILSPVLLALHDALFKASQSDSGRPFDTPVELYPKVIIAGFGRFGQIVGRILVAKKIAFTALEINQTQVDFIRRFGSRIYYGDASRLELLRAAHAENAEILVLAIDDVESSVKTAELIRKHFPNLKIFARARNRQHAFRLMDLSVRYTIRETLVSSLEMTVQVLESLGLSKSKALETVHQFRAHDEATMAKQDASRDDEGKLLETARESAEQLFHLFETDMDQPQQVGPQHAIANT
jgi:monovalent cation:proton antiporter-2 (CPA2) family protein